MPVISVVRTLGQENPEVEAIQKDPVPKKVAMIQNTFIISVLILVTLACQEH
jgi:hypothetical protein